MPEAATAIRFVRAQATANELRRLNRTLLNLTTPTCRIAATRLSADEQVDSHSAAQQPII